MMIAALLAAVLAAGNSPAAEPMKLKPVASGYADAAGAGMKEPEGVGCDGTSVLVVADTGNGRLVRYTYGAETLVPGREIALAQLPYPIRVQIDPKGGILALDGKLRKIARLTPSGEFQGYVEPAGTASGKPPVPRSFRVDAGGNLYILDAFGGNLVVLDPAGAVQRQVPFPAESKFFSDLAVSAGGTVYLIDSVGRKVYSAPKGAAAIAPLSGSLAEDLDFPTSLEVDEGGNLLVVDQNGGGIVILGPDGSFRGRQLSMGWTEGRLRYPSQICVNGKGGLFVADRGNNRVQFFTEIR